MRFTSWLLAGALAGGVALHARPAHACGGFFCDNSQPVNQAAERIIFTHNGDGTVTSVVQVLYQGPSERFAWVLPVPGRPEVGVSSNLAFSRLQQGTNPSYRINTTVEGQCREDFESDFGSGPRSPGMFADAAVAFADGGSSAPPVTVVDSGSVGPYDYATIALDPELEDPAEVAVQWLTDNGYDVTDLGRDRLGPYLAAGMNLIAFRLTKGADDGAIRPIVLTYTGTRPMIPIRPTAVAAEDDMGVMVWVLGAHRAIPTNYRHLVLNEALLNWFSPGINYNDVVTEAANEAGGQGFVTEDARPSSELPEVFFDFEEYRPADWSESSNLELVRNLLSRYSGWDGAAELLTRYVAPPEGISPEQFASCPFCYIDEALVADLDREGFLADLEDEVVAPMRDTQTLLRSRPFSTRFYTTMSAAEMTVDPEFDLNPDMGRYSNQHVAERVIECRRDVYQFEAPWRTTLPDGQVVRGRGNTWPFDLSSAMPAVRVIAQADTDGEPEEVMDNSAAISAVIGAHNDANPPGDIDGDGVVDPVRGVSLGGGAGSGGGCGGCSTNGNGSAGFAIVFGTLALLRRRRKAA
ncbi:MAG: DUF2330 domain-containing protein [Polyangiales bacterium]|nr:DUF2330 domain-containing protein [Myxococcales bacterium]